MLSLIISGGFGVAALLFLWFRTMLPVRILKRIPVSIQGDWFTESLDDLDRLYITRKAYFNKLTAHSNLPDLFVELINCPYCLGFHFSWVMGIIIGLAHSWPDMSLLQYITYYTALVLGQYAVGLICYITTHGED